MDTPHKLNIRLPNGAQFEAEGSESTVRELFAQFMEAVRASIAVPEPGRRVDPEKPDDPGVPEANGIAAASIERALLDRLFVQDRLGNVSLRALPRGEDRDSEAMLAMLYAFNVLRGEATVTADRLMKSARQSGIQNVRLSRVLSRQSQFITESGFKKAKRYGLNNPGMRRAEGIVRGLLG